jgi:hypothetical protein
MPRHILRPALGAAIRGGQKWRFIDSFGSVRPEWQLLPSGAAVDVSGGALRGATLVANGYEMLPNGDFETAGAGGVDVFGTWGEMAGDGAIADEGSLVHGGSHAAKLTAGATANTQLTQNIAVTPGVRYALTFWTRGDGTNAGRYYVADVTNSAVIQALTSTGVTGTTYTQVTYAFTAPVGCTTVIIQLRCPATNGGIAYFDDVSLQRVEAIPYLITPTPNVRMTAAVPFPASGVVPRSLFLRLADELNGWEVRLTPNTAGTDCQIIEWVAGVQTVRASADVDWGQPELLVNGGFETAGAGGADVFGTWAEGASDGAIADEASLVHGGSHAVKLTAGAATNTRVYTSATVTPGVSYTLTFWTRGDGTRAGRYLIYDNTNAANIVATTSTGVTGTTYTQVSYTFTAPAGCTTVLVTLLCPATNGGIAYFDDVSLKRTSAINHVRATAHGSTITVDSRPDGGSTWTRRATYTTMATGLSNCKHGGMVYDTDVDVFNSVLVEAL